MNAEIHNIDSRRPGDRAEPQLRTLVVCDIADSTALVERVGDQSAANIIRKHDRLARALIEQHRGREIDKTDGFLLLFDRPIQAVAFALDYQRGLKHLSAAEGMVLRARVGIHMGDVVIWENAPEDVSRGAKPIEVEGLVKPVAARLAQLALPQQTLVSFAAAGIARRAQRELGRDAERVHWKEHGRYRFKGLPEPMEVSEVGEDKIAPMRAPRSGRTAKKILPWYRRPLTLVAEAAMLAIGIGFGTWFMLQSPPTLAFAQRDWVVVGDLHNLTGDSVFNQSVESALRISLEQSRYVNVLPELSVQQTLQRMQRNPDKTNVNRAIGSEIALRDGARALILPTLAEVGGRVRVTAEVVDPNTQTTVYSISADGNGAQSVLPSIDKVSAQLRGKLGEAIAMVSKTSQPLDKVATSNLDALRAYSLGMRAYSSADLKSAEALFLQALRIDPKFALAHIGLADVYDGTDQLQLAIHEIHSAEALRDRLSARDALYIDAWDAVYTAPRLAFEKWKLLTTVYPDYFTGQGTSAYFLWEKANRFQKAIPHLLQSASSKNPHRAVSEYLLGALYVEAGRYPDAVRYFEQSTADGAHYQNAYYAGAYAAQRKFSEADSVLARGKLSDIASFDIGVSTTRVAIALDQGQWARAAQLATATEAKAASLEPRIKARYEMVSLSLQAMDSTPASVQSEALSKILDDEKRTRSSSDEISNAESNFHIALASYLAAHAGNTKLAKQALSMIGASDGDSDTAVLSNLRSVAKAEIERVSGRPRNAIEILKPLLTGSELYITHVALMDANADARDYAAALTEAHWLSSHRGRAYLEFNVEQMLAPFNVAQSDLALLRAAEFYTQQHSNAESRQALGTFERAWPNGMKLPWLASRIQKLQTPAR